MKAILLAMSLAVSLSTSLAVGAESAGDDATTKEIRERLGAYLDAFNSSDAQAVAAFWAPDAVSLNEETGERVVGRDAIAADFKQAFEDSPGLRLTGEVDHVRLVRPEVAIAEGVATLYTAGEEPAPSAFTAVLVKTQGKWLIESSHERDLPTAPSSQAALAELEWLVGDWQDQTDGVAVSTTIRWSPNKAFLLRSFRADYEDGETFEGTQIIGWDPRAGQFRTWTFNSDGSFGGGVATRSGDAWRLEVSHTLSDGGTSTATQVITRVDDDTLRIDKIGETIDGVPAPSAEPVTVVRVRPADAASPSQGGAQ